MCVCVYECVCVFVACCLATKALKLNSTKSIGGGVNECGRGLLGVISNK